MSFLYPFFLFLLPLSLLPILLFTGFKGKNKNIVFSTIFLLRKEEFKNERAKQRIKMWLVIILRILMIATLILLLARPRYFGDKWHYAYFDASISMKEYGKKNMENVLYELLDIFGEKRVTIVNGIKGTLFLNDTSIVPDTRVDDVFFTDGKLPAEPSCKLICAGTPQRDAWIYVDSIKGKNIYFDLHLPYATTLKVSNSTKLLDSINVSENINKFTYLIPDKQKYLTFFVDYDDGLPENNYFFYVSSKERVQVKMYTNSVVLSAFFNSPPFSVSEKSGNCVSIDTIREACKNQVVFVKNRGEIIRKYINDANKLKFGNWYGYMIHSGDRSLLLFDFYPYDTSTQFYDPLFIKSLSDTMKRIFGKVRYRKNFYLHQIDLSRCEGPVSHLGIDAVGFYVCDNETIAVNIDPEEYRVPSLCSNGGNLTLKELSSIKNIQRLLVYILVTLFILETLVLYFL